MRITKRIARLVIAWDFVSALILAISIGVYLYSVPITFDYAREIFSVSATVLSILFSVFFAALAILIATGDNDFIYFLTEEGLYIEIIWNFRVTLFALFAAFVLSIVLYILALTYDPTLHYPEYPKAVMIAFTFIVSYALFATANSSHDALKYAEYRAKYVQATHIPK